MFPFTQSDKGLSIMIDGQPRVFGSSHPSYDAIISELENGNDDAVRSLVDVRRDVANRTLGRVQILNNTVLVGGREVTGRLVTRILEMVSRGSAAVDGYIRFLDNLMMNPSKTAIDELYLFIEACDLPITPEGNFLAYKRVRGDFMDIHSNSIRNAIGDEPLMERNDVCDNREMTCSDGLHFCSYTYLPSYGGWTDQNRVMVVEVNPANVVSIPSDYNNAKGRTWTYRVVGEIENWENTEITAFYTEEFSDEVPDLYEDECDCDDDCDEIQITEFYDDATGITVETYDDGSVVLDIPDGTPQEHVNDFMSRLRDITNGEVGEDTLEEVVTDDDAPAPIETDEPESTPDTDPDDVVKQKLSPNQVRDMKNNYKHKYLNGELTLTAIGKVFGIHRENVARIFRGETWAHVT
jgi:hypothetical protein